MYRYLILTLFVLSSFASAQANRDDSPWEPMERHSWKLEISGISRHEIIFLTATNKNLYFKAFSPCSNGKLEQYFSWQNGERFAHGVGCAGEKIVATTEYWQRWIYPLPKEVRHRTIRKNERPVVIAAPRY